MPISKLMATATCARCVAAMSGRRACQTRCASSCRALPTRLRRWRGSEETGRNLTAAEAIRDRQRLAVATAASAVARFNSEPSWRTKPPLAPLSAAAERFQGCTDAERLTCARSLAGEAGLSLDMLRGSPADSARSDCCLPRLCADRSRPMTRTTRHRLNWSFCCLISSTLAGGSEKSAASLWITSWSRWPAGWRNLVRGNPPWGGLEPDQPGRYSLQTNFVLERWPLSGHGSCAARRLLQRVAPGHPGAVHLAGPAETNDPKNTILVLDDVIASVDEPHVDRTVDLLELIWPRTSNTVSTLPTTSRGARSIVGDGCERSVPLRRSGGLEP